MFRVPRHLLDDESALDSVQRLLPESWAQTMLLLVCLS
jgi:hypothetical protein